MHVITSTKDKNYDLIQLSDRITKIGCRIYKDQRLSYVQQIQRLRLRGLRFDLGENSLIKEESFYGNSYLGKYKIL